MKMLRPREMNDLVRSHVAARWRPRMETQVCLPSEIILHLLHKSMAPGGEELCAPGHLFQQHAEGNWKHPKKYKTRGMIKWIRASVSNSPTEQSTQSSLGTGQLTGGWTQCPVEGPGERRGLCLNGQGRRRNIPGPWLPLGLNPAYTRAAWGPSCLSKHWFFDEFPKSGLEQLFGLNRLWSVNHCLHIARAPCKYFS